MPVHNGHVSEPERPRKRGPVRVRSWGAIVVAGVLVLGGSSAVAAALSGPVLGRGDTLGTRSASERVQDGRTEGEVPAASGIPAPAQTSVEVPAAASLCDDPAVTTALESGADADVIAAVGGAEVFRAAVAGGTAPCLSLSQPGRVWVVVNKQRALDPIDYWPEPQARAGGVQRTSGGHVRADVADALEQLAPAAAAEGAGAVGVNSGFRSYALQQSTYAGHVGSLGRAAADLISARPGHSEHQTGLAVDLVACNRGCGTLEQLAGTSQAEWLAANAWRFGFIVRYEQGMTAVTGYEWEPWHLRYIGPELAKVYHDGGYRTLEEFFGLPAAPGYVD